MGEQIYCNFECRVPPAWSPDGNLPGGTEPWFVAAMAETLWGSGVPADYDPETSVWDCNGEANYGSLDSDVVYILDFLRKERIPYVFTEEGGPDWIGEIHVFDGTRLESAPWDNNAGVMLTESEWRGMLDNTSHGQPLNQALWVFNQITEHFRKVERSCAVLPIDHLGPTVPERVECTGEYTYSGMWDHTKLTEPCPLHPDAEIGPKL